MNTYQQYIHVSRYSRWLDELRRREIWPETVQRWIDFFNQQTDNKFAKILQQEIFPSILDLNTMPSMRALMMAGPALEKENLGGYNCSYVAIDSKRAFAEVLYTLMCGTGVGFSCERQEVNKLPTVPAEIEKTDDLIVVADSRAGWARAFHAYLGFLWNGVNPKVDYSKLRPAGARLKTTGGRSSGPDPLKRLFEFALYLFAGAAGRKLNSLEVHDLVCMIGEIVVCGGVRRSALISLSNLSDQRMRDAKSGKWYDNDPQRALANNSVAYTEKPSSEIFMEEWLALVKSKSGERGIFNRRAAQQQAARWGRRSETADYGCNPCSEIILLSRQLCNLTEVIVRSDDTRETLREKVRIATIMGTFQATLTNFKFVSEAWEANTKKEALLGVSLTGIMDNPLMSGSQGHDVLGEFLEELRDYAREVNLVWSKKLDINPAAAITCVKPSGTVSQLCDTASGIHPRFAKHYLRRVRIAKKDPIYQFMIDQGFHTEDDYMRGEYTAVVTFPIKAPETSVTRDEMTALQSLELWLLYQRKWCEHKPSVTINVRDEEWLSVGAWVYDHFDEISGISFLPYSDHIYPQAPYEELTEKEYNEWIKKQPEIELDWLKLSEYEDTDMTVASQTLACVGANCELPS